MSLELVGCDMESGRFSPTMTLTDADDAPHVVGKERLKGTPSGVGVKRQKLDHPFRQQVAHHECGIDADPRPPVKALQPRKTVGAK